MSQQNSLCFPCLEKVRVKFPVFPVFPVLWPPCENISKEKFRENIKDELYEGIAHYANSHVGGIRNFFNDAEQYFAHGSIKYTSDVVDVILCAAANAIKANVGIFQNIGS